MKIRPIAAALSLALVLTACAAPVPPPETCTFLGLDTFITLDGCGKDSKQALREIQDRIAALEDQWSRTRPGSTVWQLNHGDGQPQTADTSTLALLEQALALSQLTGGAFDITIAPAADLWGFTKDAFRVPEDEELAAVSRLVGSSHLHLAEASVQLDAGSEIDLGGIAKGYALEQARDLFRKYGLTGGAANLGGDLMVLGTPGGRADWQVGIADPRRREANGTLGSLSVTDCCILTSGGYERYFEEEGRRYQHILDPHTCAPAESDLQSVTVVVSLEDGRAVFADAAATALYVMGCREALDFWRSCPLPFDMILLDAAGQVYVTPGLADSFTPDASGGYDYIFLS